VENEKKKKKRKEKQRKPKKTKESGVISEFRKGVVRENEHRITESQQEEKKTTKINRLEHTQRTTNSF
jgi:hypothetical protein